MAYIYILYGIYIYIYIYPCLRPYLYPVYAQGRAVVCVSVRAMYAKAWAWNSFVYQVHWRAAAAAAAGRHPIRVFVIIGA